ERIHAFPTNANRLVASLRDAVLWFYIIFYIASHTFGMCKVKFWSGKSEISATETHIPKRLMQGKILLIYFSECGH
ncbi:MAG: hypothetical protein FWG98_11880, partial [Candidatus Cloacimonetes bacterium]|nr:hypothetical protein [Candidatus Cloacimonadota bacterium]